VIQGGESNICGDPVTQIGGHGTPPEEAEDAVDRQSQKPVMEGRTCHTSMA
jgi:hypothetical protein